jgi:amino acid adenylation domain-containing protein
MLRPVHEQIAELAAQAPDALAVARSGESLTYRELEERASQLAGFLRSIGVGPEVPVGILAERSVEMIVSLLAVLKSGGCFLPLDPAYPEDRLALTLEDSGAAVLLAQDRWVEEAPSLAGACPRVLRLDADWPEVERCCSCASPSPASLDNLAYIIYTSGSTGRPKGVAVDHRGLAHLTDWYLGYYRPTPADRATRIAGPAFDASLIEVWPVLAAGASIHIPGDEVVASPERMVEYLIRERITLSFLPTPLAEAVLEEAWPEEVPLRVLLTGGDRLRRGLKPGQPFGLVNHYGPTENSCVTTVGCQGPEEAREDREPPTIGRVLAGVELHVVDPADLAALPDGEDGELLVGGTGLARGYHRRPGLTAERFIPDPFGEPGARLYRTGDLVRRLPTGELDFIGRIDFQVKIRGYRLELGEIEAVLMRHPGVLDGVVVARDEGHGEKRLVGYVVPGSSEELTPAVLKGWLGKSLPDWMIPSAWVFLSALPLTPNGKVDRRALPAPERSDESYVAPRTPAEERLAAVFAQVLGIERVGVEDDFFELGGHSLRATQVLSRLRSGLGVELPQRALFDHPTVSALARAIEGLGVPSGVPAADWEIRPVPRPASPGEGLPVSYTQRGLWLAELWSPGTAQFNVSLALGLAGPLDPAALAASLAEIVRRHEPLRTTFHGEDGVPVQVIAPPGEVPLPVFDLSGLPADARHAEAARIEGEEARHGFDLARDPMLRTRLLRLGEAEHTLLALTHHICSDDWSVFLFARELSDLYRACGERSGAAAVSPLPELAVQYADFASWQNRWLESGVIEEQLGAWRERLSGNLPVLHLPADRPRPPVQSARGGRVRSWLPARLIAELDAVGRRAEASPFMTFLAGFGTLLSRLTGDEDVLIGSPIAGRHREEVEGLIGFFINTLVLRLDLTEGPTFLDLVGRARERALEAYSHQDVPFEVLVEELQPGHDLSRNRLVQVFLVLGNAPRPPRELAPGLGMTLRELETGTSKADLSVFLEEEEDGRLRMTLEYDSDLFDAASLERMGGHFRALLEGAAADPWARIADLPLLSPEERRQVLVGWNRDAGPARGETVPRLVAARAAERPEAVAVASASGDLTYGELAARAGRLARRLRAVGVGPETVVGILLERSAEMVTGALAVLEAGGAYLPIDPLYPADRVGFLLEDSGALVVLTRSGLLGRLPDRRPRTVLLDWPEEEWDLPAGAELEGPGAGPENLAYLIYTSGSTGRPKGVAVQHASLANLAAWVRDAYSLTAEDRVSLVAGPAFDASLLEIWPALGAGARLLVPEDSVRLSPPRLVEWLREERVTLCFLPTPLAEAAAELLRPGDLPHLRAVLTGGDRLHRASRPGPPFRLFNHYGPTEATVCCTWAPVEPHPFREPPIGRPLAGARVYVLDGRGQPVPAGIPGEIHIGGPGVARGYLGRPDLTAERFVPDPFAELFRDPGTRLYRTGDIARYLPEGDLEFLGRADHQVKVRGFRIELGEIESALAEHPHVREAAVLVREDCGSALGGKRLVAYLSVSTPVVLENLRAFLEARMPEYMVPWGFVFLEALPLTPNGKVDRRALEETAPSADPGAGREEGYQPPRTPAEEVLAGIWARVLGIDRVGIYDDFFHLGGHSLLATQVMSRVRKTLGVELPVRALFEDRDLSSLARRIETERLREQGIAGEPIGRRPPGSAVPASFSQARLWFLDRLLPGSALYNIPAVLSLAGPLAAGALSRAVDEILRRHEALRTTFRAVDGEPIQAVHPFAPRGVPAVDLSGLPEEARGIEARRLMEMEAGRPFDLAAGPLLRVTLLRLGGEEHTLLTTFHHIVADGWSIGVLLRELTALYRAFAAGKGSPLPELPVQFADFAVWQRRWLTGGVLEGQLRYWREWHASFGGEVPVLELPADRPRPAVQTFRGTVEPLALSEELSARLREITRERGVTPFMTLLAAFQALLHRVSGSGDLAVGTPIANRNRHETEGLIGFFVNTLVLRTRLSPDLPFTGLLERVREASLGAYAHQDLPFERLVEELHPERDLSRTPVFQVAFALNAAMPEIELAPGLFLEVGEVHPEISKLDLTVNLYDEARGFRGAVEYSTDLFDRETIRRLLRCFHTLLQGIAAGPETALEALPLLTPEESRQILTDWNHTETAYPTAHPVARFEALAAERPDGPAVVAGEVSWSYGDLNLRANRLAWRLRRSGVGPETIVAILLKRSPELCAAVLAVAKAGGAHLLLAPSFPEERLGAILDDAGVQVVITLEGMAGRLPKGDRVVLALDAAAGPLAAGSAENPEPTGGPGSLAYVIFTSGSTGRPKGVAVERRPLANLIAWHHRVWPVGPGDRASLMAGIAFDAFVWELWAFLTGGAALAIPEEEVRLSPPKLAGWLARTGVTHAFLPTPLAEALLAEPGAPSLPLRVLFAGGDRLHRVRRDLPFPVANLYGPTEATVIDTCALDAGREEGDPSVGRPIDNLRVYLLDPGLRPLPAGVSGELYIAGAGLARGYLGRPDLTAASFLPDPFGPPGARMYRSGDLARYRASGDVDILGRIDHQVKIRGFRIELAEIELALLKHPAVRQAAVLVQGEGSTGKRLVAYLATGGEALEPAGLKGVLRQALPDYMVPAAFVSLSELPLTPNGKVDRRALLGIAPDLSGPGREPVAPRTPLEELVAEIWREVLKVERVGVYDSFWDLGGHSLLATKALGRIEEELGIDLPIQSIFEAPVLADFTVVLGRAALTELEELSEEEARALLS